APCRRTGPIETPRVVVTGFVLRAVDEHPQLLVIQTDEIRATMRKAGSFGRMMSGGVEVVRDRRGSMARRTMALHLNVLRRRDQRKQAFGRDRQLGDPDGERAQRVLDR